MQTDAQHPSKAALRIVLTDGTYRLMPYVIPGQEGHNEKYCFYSAGDSTPTLAVYDFSSDNSKWNFRNH